MRNFAILIFAIISTVFQPTIGTSQNIDDVFKDETPVTWVGLDFSGAKFIGDKASFVNEAKTRELIEAWNTLMEVEYTKFDVGRAFSKTKIIKAIDITKQHNASIEVTAMFDDQVNGHQLLSSDVKQIVSTYDFGDKVGMGLMFIIENFDKTNTRSVMHITFFNLHSKEVVLTERVVGTPVGFGLRNYWAGSIYYNLKEIRMRHFKTWKRKYMTKH